MAMIGDIRRFPTAKKLVGYLGLSPRKEQSGNNAQGKELGLRKTGRGDLRALLVQAAQNAMNQKSSPLHKWGWKLTLRKNRNVAVAAVARKLATAIWHLLQGHYTAIQEYQNHLNTKLLKIATVLGKETLREKGFSRREQFIDFYYEKLQLSP